MPRLVIMPEIQFRKQK